jgi:tetraacyldisaccharide 4'-kinase
MGLLRSVRFPCPVVSVGNITAGGTGKTPFVEFLARWFARKNFRIAVLARGYGRIDDRSDDEDLISEMELENVVRLPGRDRVAQGRKAIAEYRADVLILDDGFQHYRIQRTLDLVTVDATAPFANGHLLPRGLLRESPSALRRAGLIVLTRTDQVAPDELRRLREQLGPDVVETIHKPVSVRSLWNRKRHGTDWLRGRCIYAFCGVGNPDAFRRTLESLGAQVVKFRAFDDHHRYGAADIRRMSAEAQEFMAEAIVTTEKDATKVNPEVFDLPLAALRVEIEVTRNEELLEERLLEVVRDIPRAAAPIGR